MAQLAPGTGGVTDVMAGALEAPAFLDANINTGSVFVTTWRYSFHQRVEIDDGWERVYDIDTEGVNYPIFGSLGTDAFNDRVFGTPVDSHPDYSSQTEHSNFELNADTRIYTINEPLGEHSTLLPEYMVAFGHENLNASTFSFDVFIKEKAKPNYIWTGGSF